MVLVYDDGRYAGQGILRLFGYEDRETMFKLADLAARLREKHVEPKRIASEQRFAEECRSLPPQATAALVPLEIPIGLASAPASMRRKQS